MKGESISAWANREKARWLRRVMYDSTATPTQKCFAYAVSDYLNSVTLDCWPAQETLARRLGLKCTRTVQRAARGLEKLGLMTVKRNKAGKSAYRYAPVLSPLDDDFARNSEPAGPKSGDRNVKESSLGIHITSYSTAANVARPAFKPHERGALEVRVARLLGPAGLEILADLAAIDDALVVRLCRALVEEVLSERDLAAARLAAKRK